MIRAAGAALALLIPFGAVASPCSPGTLDIRGPFGSARFAVEIADAPEEKAQGLMWRESLPRFAGMLFVYDAPEPVSFWMMNTLIPLDLVFIGADGRVAGIHPDAVPGDLTPMRSDGPVIAVLEINGGLAATLGLAPGDAVRHPSLPGTAWPCE